LVAPFPSKLLAQRLGFYLAGSLRDAGLFSIGLSRKELTRVADRRELMGRNRHLVKNTPHVR